MSVTPPLKPAAELAMHGRRLPNESTAVRQARNALRVEEIELCRHIERVAAQRRALTPGGALPEDPVFAGEKGPVRTVLDTTPMGRAPDGEPRLESPR